MHTIDGVVGEFHEATTVGEVQDIFLTPRGSLDPFSASHLMHSSLQGTTVMHSTVLERTFCEVSVQMEP